MQIPQHIVIHDIGFVFDGGSLDISAEDEYGQNWNLFLKFQLPEESPLGWKLSVNERIVEKMSPEEDQWILLMKNASIPPLAESEPPEDKSIFESDFIFADNIQTAFDAGKKGPEAWMEHHRQEFLKNIRTNSR